jgi:hypothetical protein
MKTLINFMEQHADFIMAIAGFLIVTLLSIIGFFGQRWFKNFDIQFSDIKGWFNTISDSIKGLEKRVDESILNTKLNEAAIREIQTRIEQRFVMMEQQIHESAKRITHNDNKIIEIEKQILKTRMKHNEIHPTNKFEE